MFQDASTMPAIQSKKESRALGAMERLFWFMDQKHPAYLTVTAEVKGFTKVRSWRDALDAVQRRHPVLSTSINRNQEKSRRYPITVPWKRQIVLAKATGPHLRVDFHESSQQELGLFLDRKCFQSLQRLYDGANRE